MLEALFAELAPIGRVPGTDGYRRYAWTAEDAALREWFAGAAAARGLTVTSDRAGNQWAWWGDPDERARDGPRAVVVGSHLDSVPDGGAFDGPLGVISALLAVDALRADGFVPSRPIGVVHFGDEEGARFGVACAGSRMITGALPAERALALRDADGSTMADAMRAAGHSPDGVGRDDETLRRVGCFVELHVEQGRALADLDAPVGVGSAIWPHGRWRFDIEGAANHAGTTPLDDRRDALLGYAAAVLLARSLAVKHDVLTTCGKVIVEPNGVNAIPSHVTGWLDARGAAPEAVHALIGEFGANVALVEESWTDRTVFDSLLTGRLVELLGGAPLLETGAGHDAGILAAAGIPSGMLFVRNPTGISHSPAEWAELDDCRAGVAALTTVLRELTR
jgi:beta-ureidopropionase / N-carbamoyl-L-amino-acid hydrolase